MRAAVEGLFEPGELGVVVGKSFSGKSSLVAELALNVVTSGKFVRTYQGSGGRVAVLTDLPDVFKDRLAEQSRYSGIECPYDKVDVGFLIGADTKRASIWSEVQGWIDKFEPSLLIIDQVEHLLEHGHGSSFEAVLAALAALKRGASESGIASVAAMTINDDNQAERVSRIADATVRLTGRLEMAIERRDWTGSRHRVAGQSLIPGYRFGIWVDAQGVLRLNELVELHLSRKARQQGLSDAEEKERRLNLDRFGPVDLSTLDLCTMAASEDDDAAIAGIAALEELDAFSRSRAH